MIRSFQIASILFVQMILSWTRADSEHILISGYLPDYRSYINVNASSVHLTDLMLFSITPETIMKIKGSDGCCVSSDHYDLIRQARLYKLEKQSKILRLLLTVGGAGRSNGFSQIIRGGSKGQKQFVNELINLCENEQLDGIDFDHEGIQSLDEWKAYQLFLVFAAIQFNKHKLILSVAVHPGQFLSPQVCQAVDRVHVMAYDMIGQDQKPGHHAEITTVKSTMQSFIDKGCQPSKLMLGIPAYARHGQNPGLVKTYSEIMDTYLLKAPKHTSNREVYSMSTMDGYYFDSPDIVRSKVIYAKEVGLAGIFYWELGQDKHSGHDGGILLQAASSASTSSTKKDEL